MFNYVLPGMGAWIDKNLALSMTKIVQAFHKGFGMVMKVMVKGFKMMWFLKDQIAFLFRNRRGLILAYSN